jgi:heme a synthase
MHTTRRISLAALAVAFAHLVFGGIVRITGSGMGCGDHWPTCHGEWFPPLDRPDLIIELTHRYLAVLLGVVAAGMCLAAWSRRSDPEVAGRGGVLRGAVVSFALVGINGLFGALTVRYGNPWWATVPHWVLAMAAVAAIASTVIRAGALGGTAARAGGSSPRTRRAALAALVLAFGAVAMGGMTAKYESAAVACPSFPHCGTNPDAAPGAAHIQLTHRTLAFLLALHLLGVAIALPRRNESAVVTRAAIVAFGLTVAQIVIAGAMIGLGLLPLPRALHQTVGVGIWVSTFVFYYLARRTARISPAVSAASVGTRGMAVPTTDRA